MVHHIQVRSTALTSHFKVTDSFADSPQPLLHETSFTCRRKKLRRCGVEKTSQQVAYSASITRRRPSSSARAAPAEVLESGEATRAFAKELATLIQYGAQLRSQFQDTNTEVSRRPISLKAARAEGAAAQPRSLCWRPLPLTTVP